MRHSDSRTTRRAGRASSSLRRTRGDSATALNSGLLLTSGVGRHDGSARDDGWREHRHEGRLEWDLRGVGRQGWRERGNEAGGADIAGDDGADVGGGVGDV